MNIWIKALHLYGLNRTVNSWSEVLMWVFKKLKGKALISIMLRIAWKASIYHICRERNNRLYGQIPESSAQLFHYVRDAIQIKTGDLVNITENHINKFLCRN